MFVGVQSIAARKREEGPLIIASTAPEEQGKGWKKEGDRWKLIDRYSRGRADSVGARGVGYGS